MPGNINPADLSSRGCFSSDLVLPSWWEGPKWLYDREANWPIEGVVYYNDQIDSGRKASKSKQMVSDVVDKNQVSQFDSIWFANFSNYLKNVQLIA